eukprot:CAMPEP_0175477330 /NCGR_PEP_ID=MMETSP0095-20121207/76379_1 /TAXON_ID=311494 /ORGANISM="Alexandrium monilatum, Strain CCMP3105" /LENGTH=261 /DNA_ID=CAMNT_0016778929 /DNA_START=33 /DNA_END=819 /DNA_ORIENTATION=+
MGAPTEQAEEVSPTSIPMFEPLKVEDPQHGLPDAPALQPVKLELPVKLLRLDAKVQVADYDACTKEGLIDGEGFEPVPVGRSCSLPDNWASAVDGYSPWTLWPGMESPSGPGADSDVAAAGASRGSALHAAGKCRPCAWFWKPGSCQNSDNCAYCHLCPEGELKARKKAKVAMMRLGIVTPKAKAEPEQDSSAASSGSRRCSERERASAQTSGPVTCVPRTLRSLPFGCAFADLIAPASRHPPSLQPRPAGGQSSTTGDLG